MSMEECIKDEPWSPEDIATVASEAALTGLYEGHQVKDEMVIGPEVMQARHPAFRSALEEIGYRCDVPNTDISLEVVVIKEEISSAPSEVFDGLDEAELNQNTPSEELVRECFIKLDHILIDKHTCKDCLKIFVSEAGISAHKCQSKNSLKKGKILKNKPCICDICEKHFGCKLSLINHMVIHSEKLFICEHCGDQFTHGRNLTCHLKRHEVRMFFCDICSKGFSLKCTLIRHMHVHVDWSQKFACKSCAKVFTYRSHLYRHIRLHTDEKRPYSCESCDSRFTQKHHLVRHTRTHTKEKPYSCGICGKKFAVKHHLTRHVDSHSKTTSWLFLNTGSPVRKRSARSRFPLHTGLPR